jgi:C-terminal processing protease CtpA/Prc
LDDVSIQKALQARRGEVVIATVGPGAKTTDCDYLGLVLKLVPLHQEEQQQQQEQQQQHQHPKPKHAIVVESIHPQSPLQQTNLRPGMILFQINNINIENQSIARIEHFLRTATVRPLRLWAQVPSGAKEIATDATTESSKATSRETPQQTEDNNRSSNTKTTATKNATTIPTKTILAVAHKEEINQSLGIALRRSDSGKFFVEKIDPTSPFYPHETSLLREGMIVTSINGLSITGMTKAAALSAIEDAPSSVLLSADVPPEVEEPPILRKRIVATIYKNSPDMRVGLSLVRVPNASKTRKFITVVSRIAPYCPFRDTNLDIGMEITSVNGMDVSKCTAREILHYIQECGGKVTILAEMDVPAEESVCTSVASVSHSTLSSSSRTPSHHQEGVGQPAATQSRTSGNTGTTGGSSGTPHHPHQYPRPVPPSYHEDQFSAKRTGSLSSSNKTPPSGPSRLVGIQTASVMKLSPEHMLGVALNEEAPGVFIVSQLSPDSPFQHTHLHVGSQILRINGIQLSGVDMMFVQMLLYKATGEVIIDFVAPRDMNGMPYSTAGTSNASW